MKLITFYFLLITSISFSQSSFGNKEKAETVNVTNPAFIKGFYSSLKNLHNKQPVAIHQEFDSILFKIRDAIYCKSDIDWRDASYDDKDPFYPCNKSEYLLRKVFSTSIEVEFDSVWCLYDGHFIYCKVNDNFYPVVMLGKYAVINCDKSYKKFKITDPVKAEKKNNSPALDAQDYGVKEFKKDLGYFTGYPNKIKQFLLSMENGKIVEFTNESLAKVLQSDSELYDEFLNTQASKVNKMQMLYKFNQKHPIAF